jgi:hypothetical protein
VARTVIFILPVPVGNTSNSGRNVSVSETV